MRKTTGLMVCAIVVGASLPLAPAADAAWWPFGKKERNAEPVPEALPPEALPPAAVPVEPLQSYPPQPGAMQAPQAMPPPVAPQAVAPPQPAAPQTAVAPAVDSAERLNRAEAQIRELTGQVEQLTFKLGELRQTLEAVQAENDSRFNALEGGSVQLGENDVASGAASADQPMDHIGPVVEVPVEDPLAADRTGSVRGAPEQPLGRMVIDAPSAAPDRPIDLTPGAGGAPAVRVRAVPGSTPAPRGEDSVRTASLGDPAAEYEQAYGSILSGDYAAAETEFRDFLSTFPGDARAPDAQYWLGESLFVRGEYGDAADQFLAGYKSYPDSAKAPDTLLKLGLSLAGLGEREAACSTYAEVLKQYPKASNALRQRVSAEQAIASC